MHPCLNQLSAVVFDFDGTLAPNLDLKDMRRQVTAFTLAQGVPAHVIADHYMVEMIDQAEHWLHDNQAHPEEYVAAAHALITQLELTAAKQTSPFAHTRPLLRRLRENSKRLAVVTRNCREAITLVVPELEELCDSVLARDDTEHLKPDPRHGQLALNNMGCKGGQTAMVGDGQMDMQFGSALGMFCIGVLSGSSDTATLTAAGADLVINDIGQLLD